MNLTMKRSEVMRLWNGLHLVDELSGNSCQNVQFAYAIAKTKRYLKDEVKSMRDSMKPNDAMRAYEKPRLELCNKHAAKDTHGNPRTRIDQETGQDAFVMLDQDAFNKELEELQTDHTEAIEEREKQEEAYKKLMKEEVTVEVHQVAQADVPAEITVAQMTNIFDLVVDNPE